MIKIVSFMFIILMIIPVTFAGSCITTTNCVNNEEINSAKMCVFNINVPDSMTGVFIDVDQGSRLNGSKHFDFVVDTDDTNISIWVYKDVLPLYIVCSEASASYEKEQYIESVTIGLDENYSKLDLVKGYDYVDRNDFSILVSSSLLMVLGLFGMFNIISKFFK